MIFTAFYILVGLGFMFSFISDALSYKDTDKNAVMVASIFVLVAWPAFIVWMIVDWILEL